MLELFGEYCIGCHIDIASGIILVLHTNTSEPQLPCTMLVSSSAFTADLFITAAMSTATEKADAQASTGNPLQRKLQLLFAKHLMEGACVSHLYSRPIPSLILQLHSSRTIRANLATFLLAFVASRLHATFPLNALLHEGAPPRPGNNVNDVQDNYRTTYRTSTGQPTGQPLMLDTCGCML